MFDESVFFSRPSLENDFENWLLEVNFFLRLIIAYTQGYWVT